jgi:TRAP-type C4-dicarboxylate transport system permease small subunit
MEVSWLTKVYKYILSRMGFLGIMYSVISNLSVGCIFLAKKVRGL